MNNIPICTGVCTPPQILTVNLAINKLYSIEIYDSCDTAYDYNKFRYAYSLDGLCWSCYSDYIDIASILEDIHSDFYLRIRLEGPVSKLFINDIEITDYSTQLESGFNFKSCSNTENSNMYNPYANMDCAIGLYQQLSDTVSCMFGIPIYYFKLSGNPGSKDITFKEYALMDVEAVKQIKLMIKDGQMPSSKSTFTDFGLDWESDWETEISKSMFATAFGINAQPQEGDLIYIPMMKRMWMVNESYDEKKDGFMWVSTSFKVSLTKYQEKGSVDLGNVESLVDSFVKNKYDDLFGEDDNIDSGEVSTESPVHAADTLYPVYESDSTRKYVTCFNTELKNIQLYQKGTLISDYCYDFSTGADDTAVIYQHKYCGDSGTCSLIINPILVSSYSGILASIGGIDLMISQDGPTTVLSINDKPKITLESNETYFVFFRWSKDMNIIQLSAAKYTYPPQIPIYKLQNHHRFFDIDNMVTSISKWTEYLFQENKANVSVGKIVGTITNFKLFDIYVDDISEILMMYPNDKHLLINDTARKLIDFNGVTLR